MEVREAASIVRQVAAALENDTRVNVHSHPVRVRVEAGAVVLEGEVEHVAAKKRALHHAAAVDGTRGVVDRLHVAPAERRTDAQIRDAFAAILTGVPELRECSMRVRVGERVDTLREVPVERAGAIDIAIEDGVVTFDGEVISLSHKRLLGVLAWWTIGCRDVVNALEVVPPEEDNDAEIVDALALVYEIDPVLHGDLVAIECRGSAVTLAGAVATDAERHRAEHDAWALFGVDDVVNRIEVRPVPGAAPSGAR